jgi:hypothetical protein
MICIALFWVSPSSLMDTLSGLKRPKAFSWLDVPKPFKGYSYVGPAIDELPFGDVRKVINAIASFLFLADFAIPAALIFTWAGFGMINLIGWVSF